MKFRVGDIIVNLLTINDLAKACGKSVPTIRKHIERGNLPDANLRAKSYMVKDQAMRGARLYSEELIKTVSEVFLQATQGKKLSKEQKAKIVRAFMDEKKRLNLSK